MDYQKAKKGKAKATQRIFIIVFWDVLPCKIIVDRRFRGTRQYIPEDNSELHTRRRENLKSHSKEFCNNGLHKKVDLAQQGAKNSGIININGTTAQGGPWPS
jgi:hypothetical protein